MEASLAEPSGRSFGRTTVLGAQVLQDVAPGRESETNSHRSYDHMEMRKRVQDKPDVGERADGLTVGTDIGAGRRGRCAVASLHPQQMTSSEKAEKMPSLLSCHPHPQPTDSCMEVSCRTGFVKVCFPL